MLYLTCIMNSCEDLAYYGVSRAKDWVSVDGGTSFNKALYFQLAESSIFLMFKIILTALSYL